MICKIGMDQRRPDSILLFGGVIVILTGCGWGPFGPDADRDGVGIRTDEVSYEADYLGGEGNHRSFGFTVVAEFTNKTGRKVYLDRCYGDSPTPVFGVEGDGFGSAYNGAWACVGHENQFGIRPGKTRVDTLHLQGPRGYSDGEPHGELAGRFRISYGVRFCKGDCRDKAAERFGVSDYFEVTLGPGALK